MALKGKLTPKQKRFADEYLVDLNATRAYKEAGYSVKSDNAAAVEGHKLLRNPKVGHYIKDKMKAREKRTEITQDRVLKELAKIGFADIKDFLAFKTDKVLIDYDDEGKPISDYRQVIEVKPSEEVDGSLIQEVSINQKGVFTFKLHDKMAALDKIARHLGMFNDKLELSGDVGVQIIDDIEADVNEEG